MKHLIILISTSILLGTSLSAQEITAADLMAKALYEENINADYQKASEYYQKIVDQYPADAKNAAKAYYNLGICEEHLGIQEAYENFEKIITLYPDNKELVDNARNKLTNSGGVQYFTDNRDSKTYKYVIVGRQAWMAENLAYIPHVGPVSEEAGIWVNSYNGSDVEEAKKMETYKKYGCLYDLENAKLACPSGWHLSTKNDWIKLEKYLGYYEKERNERKISNSHIFSFIRLVMDHEGNPDTKWDNFSGLSLVPGGTRMPSRGGILAFSSQGFYWGDIENADNYGWRMSFRPTLYHTHSIEDRINYGMSVRCVKDNLNITKVQPMTIEIVSPKDGDKIIGLANINVASDLNNQIDSVKLFLKENDKMLELDSDYSKIGSIASFRYSKPGRYNPYNLGWDTRFYNDGKYDLSIIGYHYGAYTDTLDLSIEVVNNYSSQVDGEFTDPRDGKIYPYVNIGNQSWMAKNIDFLIEEGHGSYCYNNLVANCQTYGRLYTFETAKKACPPGWHLPSNEEWLEMEITIGFDSTLLKDAMYYIEDETGIKLKSEIGWAKLYDRKKQQWINTSGTNESGLNVLPGGYLEKGRGFTSLSEYTSLWTSSVDEYGRALYRSVQNDPNCIDRDYDRDFNEANYVRCIKDKP